VVALSQHLTGTLRLALLRQTEIIRRFDFWFTLTAFRGMDPESVVIKVSLCDESHVATFD
jgi:hypothetical protein